MAKMIVKDVSPTGIVNDKTEYTGTDEEIDRLYKTIFSNVKKHGLSSKVLIEITYDNTQKCSFM